MPQKCFICESNLTGRPKIYIEGDIYCYRCAKEAIAAQEEVIAKNQAQALKEYEDKALTYRIWKEALALAMPSKTTQTSIIIGVAIVASSFVPASFFFSVLSGLLLGLLANHFFVESRKATWLRTHPQPTFPSYPSAKQTRSKMRLVGGVTGKLLPGNYRQQILERDGFRCQCCGQVFPSDKLEIHHIKPQAKGGKSLSTNLITLCYTCHLHEDWFGHKHKMRKRRRLSL
jgi:hypothetical protein